MLIFANISNAQIENTQVANTSKVAKLHTDLFNKEHGIKVLIQAENTYNVEYYEQFSLEKKINNLKEEINYLLGRKEPINDKYAELQKLTVKLNQVNATTKAERERKFSLIVAPIIKKINKKVKEFAKLKGYFLVLDEYSEAQLIEGEIVDATWEFIKFCNESFDKEKLK